MKARVSTKKGTAAATATTTKKVTKEQLRQPTKNAEPVVVVSTKKADSTVAPLTTAAAAKSKMDQKTSPHQHQSIDEELTTKALTALLRHHTEGIDPKKSLLGTDVAVQVQFGLEVAPGRAKTKPIPLTLPNPLYKLSGTDNSDDKAGNTGNSAALEEPEVCLIVKEESKAGIQDMIAEFPQFMGCIKKVMGLQSLRTKHGEFKQRRDLLARYTCFLADDRILPMLTSALGKDFLAAKKQPIPVRITRKESLPFAIQKALSATYLHIPEGTCVTVRAGFTHMAVDQLVQNVAAVCTQVGSSIPRKWANIRSIAVKLPESTALPIYNKTPAELHEIAQLAGLSSAWKSVEECAAEKEQKLQQLQQEKVNQQKKDAKRKTEKSPLLRALKKQKKDEAVAAAEESTEPVEAESAKEPDVSAAAASASAVSTRAKRKSSTPAKEEVVSSPAQPTQPTQSSKKDSASKKAKTTPAKASAASDNTPSTDKKSATKDKTLSKDASSSSKVVSPASTPAKTRSSKKDEAEKSTQPNKADTKTSENKTFLPTKTFGGSKKGYVFKNGPNGVGYYIDVKPVVNKAALEALARSRPPQQRQGQRGSGGGGGSGRGGSAHKRGKSPNQGRNGGKFRRR